MEDKLLARVHSFESFGAVDGPGIRYIIFMQGCHLQCKYCQNRDTWDVSAGTLYSVSDLMKKILKYKNYFIASGGGVTVSGGEPLLQSKFLIELFKELKKENITIAVDTSGSVVLTDTIKEVISLADLFLLDIKCINDDICKDLTGVSNKRELEFARYLSDNNKDIWIRQVLIPDITQKNQERKLLQGEIGSSTNPPSGCRFHNRCPYATEECRREVPELRNVDDRGLRQVACPVILQSGKEAVHG